MKEEVGRGESRVDGGNKKGEGESRGGQKAESGNGSRRKEWKSSAEGGKWKVAKNTELQNKKKKTGDWQDLYVFV